MINNQIGYIICEGNDMSRPESTQMTPKTINGKSVAKAILQTADEKNRNGRFYETGVLFPALKDSRILELMNAKELRAEAGHPMDTSLQRQALIDIPKTCAFHLRWWTEGNDVWGEFVATNNDLGREFDLDLKEGVKPAWSLRALGSVNQTSRGAEVRNIRIITYDRVIFPSHMRAYTQDFVYENANIAEKKSLNESVLLEGQNLECTSNVIPITNKDVVSFLQCQSNNLKFVKECFDFVYSGIQLNENNSKVILTEKETGNTIVINMEDYVHNELMTYASDIINKY
jgi:hypothetical protein